MTGAKDVETGKETVDPDALARKIDRAGAGLWHALRDFVKLQEQGCRVLEHASPDCLLGEDGFPSNYEPLAMAVREGISTLACLASEANEAAVPDTVPIR